MESILSIDIPVQMFSCTDTTGKITPLRFRFRDKTGEIIAVYIESIIKAEQDKNVFGANFTCSAFIFGEKKTFTLRYNYQAHEWRLSRISV